MTGPAATIVVVSHNEGERLRQTVEALLGTTPPSVRVVVVDDHSTDESTAVLFGFQRVRLVRPPRRLGVAGARNYGARIAEGRVLVFSDAHVTPADGWLLPLCTAIDSGAAAAAPGIRSMVGHSVPGYGFTWREPTLTTAWLRRRPPAVAPAPMLCGCFLAVDRDVFRNAGGFDEGLQRWGFEDAELSLRLWRMGERCVVVPDSQIRHLFRPRFHYRVDWTTTLYNVLRLAVVHFGERALSRVLDQFAANPALPGAYAEVVDDDAWLRRAAVSAVCRFDDEWFFDRFGIDALR
jgi:GT2 family glycosyltransferase